MRSISLVLLLAFGLTTVSAAPTVSVAPLSSSVTSEGAVAKNKSKSVEIAGGGKMTVGELADGVLEESRAREKDLKKATPALASEPVVEETYTETANEIVITSKTKFTVKDPQKLRATSPRFRSYRAKFKSGSTFKASQLKSGPKKNFDSFRASMKKKPKGHPLREPAIAGDEQLMQAVLAGKGDVTITTSVVVPKKRPKFSGKSAAVPTYSGGTLSYKTKATRNFKNVPVGTDSPGKSIQVTDGKKNTVSKFLTGFTEYQSFKWVERWDFGSRDYFKITAEAGYAFGLRIPVEVTGTLKPTKITTRLGTDKACDYKVELKARAFDANKQFYKDTGLSSKEAFDGDEFVMEADAFLKIDLVAGWGTIKIHERIPKKLGVDWSKDIRPPFGNSGTSKGIDLWVPATITRTKISILGIVVGKAQIGVNLSGSGKVKVDYMSLYDGNGIDSKFNSKKRNHTLTYADNVTKKITTTLPAMTQKGQKKYGYQLSKPRYSWSLKATPGLKGAINLNAKPFFEERIGIGPFWFNEFALRLGTIDFKAHAGTKTVRKIQKGLKTFSEPTKTQTTAKPSTNIKASDVKRSTRTRKSRKVRRNPR